MTGNGVIAGLVGITAPSGYVEYWAALPIGLVAGVLVVVCIIAIDKVLDDPIGALSAHGVAGVWGTLACGLFTAPRLAEYNAIGEGGLFYTGSFEQLGVQALGVAAAFTPCSWSPTSSSTRSGPVYGLRVSTEQERRGLDIVEHGMWGYPGAVHAGARIRVPPAEHSGCAGRRARDRRCPRVPRRARHEEDRGDHPARAAAGGAGRARRAGRVRPDRDRRGRLRAPEGLHRVLPRHAGEHLAAAEDQGGVGGARRPGRGRRSRRSSAARARARSATGECSSTRSNRRSGSAPARSGEETVRHEVAEGWGH